jgi:hypothetical protein
VTGKSGDSTWVTTTTNYDSAPNAAYVPAYNHQADIVLDSSPIPITKATATLSFWTRFDTQPHYDGGALEISIGGGAFTDILAAGGSFVTGAYNDTLISLFNDCPLAGRQTWSGSGVGPVKVNLPASAAGQNVVFRWRMGTGSLTPGNGWWIDTILVDP